MNSDFEVAMFIRAWGARGSLPVSGSEFLNYGGNTTCIEVRNREGNILIIDAGTGICGLGRELENRGISEINFFFSHFHLDHVIGFPFFAPLFSSQNRILLYRYPEIQGKILQQLSDLIHPPYFPVSTNKLWAGFEDIEIPDSGFYINSTFVEVLSLSHPNNALGFKFQEKDRIFVFIPDNELGYSHKGACNRREYLDFCKNADLLIHDAEYTEEEYCATRTWGHSTFTQALDLAMEANVKQLGLFHHNINRTDLELDSIVQDCKDYIEANKQDLHCFAVRQNQEWEL